MIGSTRTRRTRRTFRPALECLEDRWLPSTFNWFQSVDGNFNDPTKWHDQNGNTGVPGPNDFAVIGGSGFIVTSSQSNTVLSLFDSARLNVTGGTFTVGDPINTTTISQLVVSSGAGFQVTAGTTFLTGGTEGLGNFNVAGGAKLVINGGTHHFDTGTTLGGAGEYHLSGGTLSIDAAVNAPAHFFLDGGTLTGTGTFTVTNGAALDFSVGTMTGQGGNAVIASDGSLTLDGPGKKFVAQAYHLTNNGQMTWKDNGVFDFASGAILTNNGTWTVGNDLNTIESSGPDATFNNGASGTLTKTAGAGSLIINSPFNNDGAVHVASGTVDLNNGGRSTGSFDIAGVALQITSGSYTFAGGTAVTDTGTLRLDSGTLTLSANVELPNFAMSGGVLTGTNMLTVDNSFNWTGGTMTGSGSAVSNGSLVIDGPNDKDNRSGHSLVTNGSVTWQGAGLLDNDIGATITNNGTWSVMGDLPLRDFSGPDGTFTNSATGTFTKAAGPGTLLMDDIFNNAGAVSVNSGTLQLDDGGFSGGSFDVAGGAVLQFTRATYTWGSGTTVTDAGTPRLDSGTLTLAANVELPNFSVTGGTLNGSGTLTVDNSLSWTGGTMTDFGTVVSNGSLVIDGPADKDNRSSHHLVTNGSVTWQGAGLLDNDISASITNNGTWTVMGDLSLREFNGPDGIFINSASGTFTKAAGPGTLFIDTVFNNAGMVNINSGTLQINRGGFDTGAFNGLGGTTLNFSGAFGGQTNTLAAGASLTSAGLVQVTGAAVVVSAAVSVQSFELDSGSVELGMNGVLNVGGNYTQRANTTLFIDIGGTTAGAGYGQLNVTGTANLNGTLQVNLVNDFAPSIGDSYQVLTFGARNGDFVTKNFPNLGNNGHFVATYDAHDLFLTVSM